MALFSCRECNARVSSAASACPHCGCPVTGSQSSKPHDIRKLNTRVLVITVSVLVLVGGLGVFGAFKFISFASHTQAERNRAKEQLCQINLKQIGTLMEVYRKDRGGENYSLPDATGSQFIRELKQVASSDAVHLFDCPVGGTLRGPSKNLNAAKNYSARDAILVCVHPDGSLICLTKSYQVRTITKDSGEDYTRAMERTTDR